MSTNTQQWRPHELEDELVKLRLLQQSDFEDLFQVASDPAIWREHPISNRYQRDVFQRYFDLAISSTAAFLVIEKTTGQIIGCTVLHDHSPQDSSIAIGFTFLARKYWGRNFNLASKKLLINYAFQFVHNVSFLAGVDNIRPQITLQKLGARLSGQVDFKNGDQIISQNKYVISKKDWKSTRIAII